MDRSNFNPDQLHEHFDRIKGNFGIELEDSARMVKLPTGHRFVVGQADHYTFDNPEKLPTTELELHTEAGRVGKLWMTERGNNLRLINEGNVSDTLRQVDPNVPVMRHMVFPHLRETQPQEFQETDFHIMDHNPQVKTTLNPSSEYINSSVEEANKFANRDVGMGPGLSGVFLVHRNANPDLGPPGIPSEGFFHFDRKSGRFERLGN